MTDHFEPVLGTDEDYLDSVECEFCQGRGYVLEAKRDGSSPLTWDDVDCDQCGGKGYIEEGS